MAIKKYKAHVLTAFVNICSFLVAAIFIFSGFTKAVDPVGGGIKTIEDKIKDSLEWTNVLKASLEEM